MDCLAGKLRKCLTKQLHGRLVDFNALDVPVAGIVEVGKVSPSIATNLEYPRRDRQIADELPQRLASMRPGE